jgi:hypothetical protein
MMIAGKLIRQGFDCDVTFQFGVVRPIDFAHSTGSDQPDNFILPESSTWT